MSIYLRTEPIIPDWTDYNGHMNLAFYIHLFDQGWDVLREEIYERQLAMGVIPKETVNTPRPEQIPSWEEYPDRYKPVASRLMEIFASFLHHTAGCWQVSSHGGSTLCHEHRSKHPEIGPCTSGLAPEPASRLWMKSGLRA